MTVRRPFKMVPKVPKVEPPHRPEQLQRVAALKPGSGVYMPAAGPRAVIDVARSGLALPASLCPRAPAPAAVWAEYKPQSNPPALANLPTARTFNGVAVQPKLRVRADGAGGLVSDVGGVWSVAGSGAASTDLSAYRTNPATRYNGGKFHTDGSTLRGDCTTGDLWFEALFTYHSATEIIASKFTVAPLEGWELLNVVGGGLRLRIGDGVTGIGYLECVVAGLVEGQTYFLCCGINRDEASTNGGQIYLNSVASGAGVNFSAMAGSVTSPCASNIGARFNGTLPLVSNVQYFALYEQAAWFSAGAAGPAEWLSVHREMFELLSGQQLASALGTKRPATLASRTDHTLMRKEHATLGTLWIPRAAHWPTVEHDAAGEWCYAPVLSRVAGGLQNGDFLTTWSKAGAAAAAAIIGPDGASRNVQLTLGVYPTDCFTQANVLTGATTCCVCLCVKRPTGATGILRFANLSGVGSGDWLIDLEDLTEERWYFLTADSSEVTVVAPWAPVAGNVGFIVASSVGLITAGCCFPTAYKDPPDISCLRPVAITTAARTTSTESPMFWDDASNVPADGLVTYDGQVPNGIAGQIIRAFGLSRSSGSAHSLTLFRYESPPSDWIVRDASTVTSGNLSWAAAGTRVTAYAQYSTLRGVRFNVNGLWESGWIAKIPTAMTRIRFAGWDGSGAAAQRIYALRVEQLK